MKKEQLEARCTCIALLLVIVSLVGAIFGIFA